MPFRKMGPSVQTLHPKNKTNVPSHTNKMKVAICKVSSDPIKMKGHRVNKEMHLM